MGLNAENLAHGVQPPVLLHPLLVVCDEQPPIVDPTRINPCLLELVLLSKMAPVLHARVLQNFNGTDLLKPCDNFPGVGEELDLCVVWSEAPEKTSSVPCCACNPAQTLFFFKG